jgi:uncharacterized protein (DUF433 family)
MVQHNRIAIDPKIMTGKPCIKGTRISVELILEKLAEGMSHAAILADHPRLSEEDILAALTFALDVMKRQDIILADGQRL